MTFRQALMTALCVSTMGCGATHPDFFKNQDLGVDVKGFDWATAKHSTTAAGDDDYQEDGDVVIDGQGEHWVDVEDDEQPAAAGGKETLTVVDRTSGDKRIYAFDPVKNALSFSDGTKTLDVVRNADQSYTVDGVAAANGKAAVALLKQSPVYRDASAWGFVMTYSACQSCLERAASRGPNTQDCAKGNAAGGAVCDKFRDLCDCAACDKLNKTPCALCP